MSSEGKKTKKEKEEKKEKKSSSDKKEKSSSTDKKEKSSDRKDRSSDEKEGKTRKKRDKSVDRLTKSKSSSKSKSGDTDKPRAKPSSSDDEFEKSSKEPDAGGFAAFDYGYEPTPASSEDYGYGYEPTPASSEDYGYGYEPTPVTESESDQDKGGFASFDAFGGDAFGGGAGFGGAENKPAPGRRPRARRLSIGKGPAPEGPGLSESDHGQPPRAVGRAKSLDLLDPQAPRRARARRASAVGHVDAGQVANFVIGNKSSHSVNGADFDEIASLDDYNPKGPSRSGSDQNKVSDVAAISNRKKLVDDFFGDDFSSDAVSKTKTAVSGDFVVPMMDAGPAGADTNRRPRRRASLTAAIGGFREQLGQEEDDQRQQNKTGFFKDRSGDKKRATPKLNNSNENLTGYDPERDRRRFMG